MQRFKHDCEDCRFVGQFDREYTADGYVCTVTKSIILRHGDDPSDYGSVPGFIMNNQELYNTPELVRFREVYDAWESSDAS